MAFKNAPKIPQKLYKNAPKLKICLFFKELLDKQRFTKQMFWGKNKGVWGKKKSKMPQLLPQRKQRKTVTYKGFGVKKAKNSYLLTPSVFLTNKKTNILYIQLK